MKNKKSLLSLGLLALVLVLGVGYAVVSSVDIELGGKATVQDSVIDVKVVSIDDAKNGATVSHTLTEPGIKDTFTITNMEKNKIVTMTYTVKNNETDVTALLSKSTFTYTNDEYFDVTYNITKSELAPQESTTIVVTVELTKTPVVAANSSTEVTFAVDATAKGAI